MTDRPPREEARAPGGTGQRHELETTNTLFRRMKGGDDRARDRLFERYLARLRTIAHCQLPANVRHLLDTDDLVQEIAVGTLRTIEHFDLEHSGAFHAYLRSALRNRIRDALRRVARSPVRDGTLSALADPGPSPIELAIGNELLDRYERGLRKLSAGDREAVIARIELGFSYREVAVAIGKPSPDAARMAVRRAVERLAEGMAGAE